MLVVNSLLPDQINVETSQDTNTSDAICAVNEKDMIRVLSNLLLNASHAMNQSGTININMELTQESDIAEKCIKLDIIDHGYGIEPDLQEKIFDPFFTTKDVGQGTGLGLPIVYNIISSWSGDIFISSEIGKGSTFTIIIPIIE